MAEEIPLVIHGEAASQVRRLAEQYGREYGYLTEDFVAVGQQMALQALSAKVERGDSVKLMAMWPSGERVLRQLRLPPPGKGKNEITEVSAESRVPLHEDDISLSVRGGLAQQMKRFISEHSLSKEHAYSAADITRLGIDIVDEALHAREIHETNTLSNELWIVSQPSSAIYKISELTLPSKKALREIRAEQPLLLQMAAGSREPGSQASGRE